MKYVFREFAWEQESTFQYLIITRIYLSEIQVHRIQNIMKATSQFKSHVQGSVTTAIFLLEELLVASLQLYRLKVLKRL